MAIEASAESLQGLKSAIASGMRLLVPPPDLLVSQWSDSFAVLPKESSAQHGRWITETAEYQRGFMDAMNEVGVEKIVAIWGAQMGKSAGLLNIIGFFAEHDPSPILMVQPTLERAEDFSKDRIAPMIRDTPRLKPLFGDPRSRDSGNTLLHKQFPGGYIALAGANAPAGLASRPIRIVLCDEVDKYGVSAGTEGDPVKLAMLRTTTYWNRKIVLTSTPGVKGASRVESEFLKSDQRFFFVPCPHCGVEQILEWARLKWPRPETGNGISEHRPEECYYVCQSGCEIREHDKPDMVRAGRWVATAKSIDGKTAGFRINAMYSPWVKWPEMIQAWLGAQTSVEELQTFVNGMLAETWEVKGERVERSVFAERTHAYPAEAPQGVLVITAGVDVQKDRIEAQAIGWGRGEESWALEHVVFYGSPTQPDVWGKLDDWLKRDFEHESGLRLKIRCAMVDSGDGGTSKTVYAFTRPRERHQVFACKGYADRGGARPLLSRPTDNNEMKAKLFPVGVDTAKSLFFARLALEAEGPGYCHFAESECFDTEFFAQMAGEELRTKYRSGIAYKAWVKIRDRNEALDTRVYAMAALAKLKPHFGRLADDMKRQIEAADRERGKEPEPVILGSNPQPTPGAKTRMPAPRRPSWVNGWKG